MTVTAAGNLTGIAGVIAKWADNDADPYDRATQLYALARYLNEHTHKGDGTMGAPILVNAANENQLANGGLESWSLGAGPFTGNTNNADKWTGFVQGTDTLSISKDTVNKDVPGSAAAACTFTLGNGGGASRLYQSITNMATHPLNGQQLSLSVRIKTSVANAVRVSIDSQTASTDNFVYSSYHTGDGTWQSLTVTAPWVASTITQQVNIHFAASTTVYVDNVMLVTGATPVAYIPLTIPDEIVRIVMQGPTGGINQGVTGGFIQQPTLPNMLVNGGFEIWQRGTGPFTGANATSADRWTTALVGTDTISISKNTSTVMPTSAASAAVTFTLGTGAGVSNISQALKLSDGYTFGGRTISLSVAVVASAANACRIALYDRTASVWTYSNYHSGDSAWHTLTATYAVPPNNTEIDAYVLFGATGTIYVDNAMLVVSPLPMDYNPLPPADDLARCLRYYQRWNKTGNTPYIGSGVFDSTSHGNIIINFRAELGGIPSLTTSTLSNWTLSDLVSASSAVTTMSIFGADYDNGVMLLSVNGTGTPYTVGKMAFLNSSTSGWIAIEWNP